MKHPNKYQVKIWIFFILLLLLFLCRRVYLNFQLSKVPKHSKGTIIRLVTGGNSGSIYFEFPINRGTNIESNMRIIWPSCKRIIRQEMKKLKQLEFPVVYAENNHNNAEILLFKDQYQKFNIKIPDNLKEIVTILSKCKE